MRKVDRSIDFWSLLILAQLTANIWWSAILMACAVLALWGWFKESY